MYLGRPRDFSARDTSVDVQIFAWVEHLRVAYLFDICSKVTSYMQTVDFVKFSSYYDYGSTGRHNSMFEQIPSICVTFIRLRSLDARP